MRRAGHAWDVASRCQKSPVRRKGDRQAAPKAIHFVLGGKVDNAYAVRSAKRQVIAVGGELWQLRLPIKLPPAVIRLQNSQLLRVYSIPKINRSFVRWRAFESATQ